MLGRANSRMKDFYDIWLLSKTHSFEDDRLARAIAATFLRRKTEIPSDIPDALTADFAEDPTKQEQWIAFVSGIEDEAPPLADTVAQLARFLMPHATKGNGADRPSISAATAA